MLKELIVEMLFGIISPSKTMIPSIAKTKRGKRFYLKKHREMLVDWRQFLIKKHKEEPDSPVWDCMEPPENA